MHDQGADRFDDVPRIQPNSCQNHAHQNRQQDQTPKYRQRRAAEEAVSELVGLIFVDLIL